MSAAMKVRSDLPRRRVLIADDDPLIRMDLVEMLAEESFEVVGQVGDGERAAALAKELRPDLVIMDVKMPGKDGIQAAAEIAGEQIAPVIILTAFSERDLIQRALHAGAMTYWPNRSPRQPCCPRSNWRPPGMPTPPRCGRRSLRRPAAFRPARSSTGPRDC